MAVPVSKHLVTLALAAWVSVALEISAQETPAQTASPAIAGTLGSLERAAGVTDPGYSSPAVVANTKSLDPAAAQHARELLVRHRIRRHEIHRADVCVVAIDPEDRVLLFRYDEAPPNGRHWCTPGGGLDDGEDYPAGARRELTEETGWTDVPIGPEVYEHVRIMEYADAMVRQHERFYLARVETGRRGLGAVVASSFHCGTCGCHCSHS